MEDVNIYTPEGWLNVPALADLGCWLYVFIGPRQVGKTFGTLKYLLDHDCYHMYMRRTKDELDVITDDQDLNPYLAMEEVGYHVDLQKQGKGWIVGDVDMEDEKHPIVNRRGIGMPLGRIAKIRGFSGSRYSDVVLDEFIPEKMVVIRKSEGDAFRNALITISGNRTLKGEKPLRVWLLANANDLFSPIMISMNLVRPVEKMIRQGRELLVTENGVCICLPKSEKVITKRLSDPMLRHLNDESEFSAMAFGNEFGYDDTSLVKPKSLKGWMPEYRIGDWYVWSNGEALYCTTSAHPRKEVYRETKDDQTRCIMMHPEMTMLYRMGRVTFSDAVTLYKFRIFFKIL